MKTRAEIEADSEWTTKTLCRILLDNRDLLQRLVKLATSKDAVLSIDPGEGWRLLRRPGTYGPDDKGEPVGKWDEYQGYDGKWHLSENWRVDRKEQNDFPYRRRVAPAEREPAPSLSIDPGEGWRLLRRPGTNGPDDKGELVEEGDECLWNPAEWLPSENWQVDGREQDDFPYRRRIDPGEGWRLLRRPGTNGPDDKGELVEEGDEYLSSDGTWWPSGNRRFAAGKQYGFPYRRRVAKPEAAPDPGEGWRLLAKDEPVEEGDEYQDSDGTWFVSVNWRRKKGKQSNFTYRRRVDKPERKPSAWPRIGKWMEGGAGRSIGSFQGAAGMQLCAQETYRGIVAIATTPAELADRLEKEGI